MEIPCPSCHKLNAASPCERCGGELDALFEIRQAALSRLHAATLALKEMRPAEALAAAGQSWSLFHDPLAARIAFLSCLQSRDPSASRWFRRASRSSQGS